MISTGCGLSSSLFYFLDVCGFFGLPIISLHPVPLKLEFLLIVSYFRNILSLFLLFSCKSKKSIVAVFHRNPFSVRLFSIRRKWVSRQIVYSRRTNTPPFPPNQAITALPSFITLKKKWNYELHREERFRCRRTRVSLIRKI